MTVEEEEVLWRLSEDRCSGSNISEFVRWLHERQNKSFDSYAQLHQWSVNEAEDFWRAIWEYFDVVSEIPPKSVISAAEMPGTQWFSGALTNYAEHVLRHEAANESAVVLYASTENGATRQVTWHELGRDVRKLAEYMRATGVATGDRVVSYLPNVPETVVAMLATVAVGAIWSSAAPEFGVGTVVDRFSQIEPKLMFATLRYTFSGKSYCRQREVGQIIRQLPTIDNLILLDENDATEEIESLNVSFTNWRRILDVSPVPAGTFQFERVAHDHPLWILFSSGTTGLPKAIVHSHVGIIVEHYKMGAFHLDINPSSKMFFYTTTGWMMWNALMMAPLLGGAAVLYDGSPVHPDLDRLWRFADEVGATIFGASPAFVKLMQQHSVCPAEAYDLASLDTILLSGAPSTPETFEWCYDEVGNNIWITSQSGGTEFCSALVGGVPTLPVRSGEIQAALLGVDARVISDSGDEVVDEVGELVIKKPLPSMPLRFWGDDDQNSRYSATYFKNDQYGWWHGDIAEVTGSCGFYIYGRSDATLNRHGVRIGSSEVYRCVEGIADVQDSLVVDIDDHDGKSQMILFVALQQTDRSCSEVARKIKNRLRNERSPRHVPDEIFFVPDIPYNITGKKLEVPVRKLLAGCTMDEVVNPGIVRNYQALEWFVDFAQEQREALIHR